MNHAQVSHPFHVKLFFWHNTVMSCVELGFLALEYPSGYIYIIPNILDPPVVGFP